MAVVVAAVAAISLSNRPASFGVHHAYEKDDLDLFLACFEMFHTGVSFLFFCSSCPCGPCQLVVAVAADAVAL